MFTMRDTIRFALFFSLCLICDAQSQSKTEMDEEVRKLAKEHGIDPDNPKPGTVLLSPPKLSPEDEGSQFMPKAYRCDGCKAVAYQLTKQFEASEKNIKKGTKLSEAVILDVTEDVCDGEFKNYGLKNVQGTNYLSGEGLKANDMSGMVEAGGKWQKRLQNMCKEIMGEYEEEMVYSFHQQKDVSLHSFICSDYCNNAMPPLREDL